MSTHEHLVLTDTNKRLPDFLRRLHRLVALGTKVGVTACRLNPVGVEACIEATVADNCNL
jgi:hypothetical protein